MKISDIKWDHEYMMGGEDSIWSYKDLFGGRFTVLYRMTGFGYRDIETGYRDSEGSFWLASGNFDIRDFGDLTIEQAIGRIKDNANTCIGHKPTNS